MTGLPTTLKYKDGEKESFTDLIFRLKNGFDELTIKANGMQKKIDRLENELKEHVKTTWAR
jgi:hypothetical protein